MNYRGFDIIKKGENLYWVCCNGSMLGSAKDVKGAKILINAMKYKGC